MAKCVRCGRKGLFLRTNRDNICYECEREIINSTNRYYCDIALIKQSLNKTIMLSGSDIEKLSFIPEYEHRIELCNKAIEMLNTYKNMPMAEKVLLDKLTYEKETDKCIHHALLPVFNIYVWTNKESALSNIVTAMYENFNKSKIKYNEKIDQIKKYAAFQNDLLSISTCEIVLNNEKIPRLLTSNLNNITYSRITSKSNYTKSGNYIMVDVETTGLSSTKNEILEIAAIKFEDYKPVRMFSTLIKPKKDIDREITDITGITNELVENAPSIYEVIPCLIEFIGKENIVGHNLEFDLKFLHKNGVSLLNEKRKYYDTLELVKTILKKPKTKWNKEYQEYEIDYESDYDIEDFKLSTLCDYYQTRDNENGHRASSDAYATGILFKHIVEAKVSFEG